MSVLRKLFSVEAFNRVRESTVMLDVEFVHCGLVNSTKHGTGFINNSDGNILTCYRLVADKVGFLQSGKYAEKWIPGHVTAQLGDGSRIAAKLVAADSGYDMALLKLSTTVNQPVKPLSFAPHLPEVGDAIFCLGHPNQVPYAFRYGFLSNPSRSPGDFPEEYLETLVPDRKVLQPDFSFLDLDIRGAPGIVGAPLCNQDGEVFGILSGGSPEMTMPGYLSSYGIPMGIIQDFVKREQKRTGGVFVRGRSFRS